MTIERLKPSGDYMISTIKNGSLVKHRYSGYALVDAIAEFKQYVKNYKRPSS